MPLVIALIVGAVVTLALTINDARQKRKKYRLYNFVMALLWGVLAFAVVFFGPDLVQQLLK